MVLSPFPDAFDNEPYANPSRRKATSSLSDKKGEAVSILKRQLPTLDARLRLLISAAVGGVSFFLSPHAAFVGARLLIAWNVAVVCFLVMAYGMMLKTDAGETRRSVMEQDQSGAAILAVVIVAATTSLFAIGFMLAHSKELSPTPKLLLIALAGIAIVFSWLLVHTMFALHYAHRYYGDLAEPLGEVDKGLSFPGAEQPDYLDFAYFSFVIGMTSQVSDVQVATRRMRRLVWFHGLLSFVFYTVILAITINIVAGLI